MIFQYRVAQVNEQVLDRIILNQDFILFVREDCTHNLAKTLHIFLKRVDTYHQYRPPPGIFWGQGVFVCLNLNRQHSS